MNTPICDFVRDYVKKDPARFHMPGHKGKEFLLPEPFDLTEVEGADALYEADGIIRESEENAAKVFGTLATFYSTEGSSLGVRAMLYLAALYTKEKHPEKKQVTVLCSRNIHKSVLYSAALLDLKLVFLPGEQNDSLLGIRTDKEQLLETLSSMEELPDAVFLTSPDYLGNIADIRGFSEVLKPYAIPLLVDSAHGAYLRFLSPSLHPTDLGAQLVCTSAHKTLPALTGCAYLHVAEDEAFPERADFFRQEAKKAMALFGSTSPSYLMLQSLDLLNPYLDSTYKEELGAFIKKADALKTALTAGGYKLLGSEPLKITLFAAAYGYSGSEISEILRENGIEAEYADRDVLVLMLSPSNTDAELLSLQEVLLSIERRSPLPKEALVFPPYLPEIPVREAFFLPHKVLPAEETVGQIAAEPLVTCPPAVPLVISGERIREAHLPLFRHYGITRASVLAEPFKFGEDEGKTLDKEGG